jgi:hypothetical protein
MVGKNTHTKKQEAPASPAKTPAKADPKKASSTKARVSIEEPKRNDYDR